MSIEIKMFQSLQIETHSQQMQNDSRLANEHRRNCELDLGYKK